MPLPFSTALLAGAIAIAVDHPNAAARAIAFGLVVVAIVNEGLRQLALRGPVSAPPASPGVRQRTPIGDQDEG